VISPLRCIFLIVVCVSFLPVVAEAQSAGDRFDHDINVIVQDAADIFSAPAEFDSRDWLNVGIILGTAAAAYTVDDDVRTWVQERRTQEWDAWLRIGDWYGDGLYNSIFSAGLYAGGFAVDNEWTQVTGRMLLQSQVYSATVTQILKTLLGRARPDMQEGKHSFNLLTLKMDYHSHPSGHATSAFAFSSTLARRVGNVALSVLLYSLAMATVLQRVESDRHWLSDTVVGSILGTVIGIAVVQAEERREQTAWETHPINTGFSPHRPLFSIAVPF
jgi:membrane-associated phospholipid phosphatase